jgi:PadR family transcriptional regulator PadR
VSAALGQSPTPDQERATKAEQPLVSLPKQLLTPGLLLLIDQEPAYGYELVQRLAAFGVGAADHGSIYRALNVMESGGLVSSQWERSPSGPRRRRYCATREGRQLLCRWASSLEQADELIRAFLGRWRAGAGASHTNGVNGRNGATDRDALAETEASVAR